MGAFNWFTVKETCPRCLVSSELTFQLYVASSYAGDNTGRFHDRTYQLGDTLAWWSRDDKRFADWTGGLSSHSGCVTDVCYGKCPSCNSDLLCDLDVCELKLLGFRNLRVDVLGMRYGDSSS